MRFDAVKLSEELLELAAPPFIKTLSEKRSFETLTVAGSEEDRVLCFAFFSRTRKSRDVYLEYIYTVPGSRGRGYASALLKHCAGHMKKCGFGSLLVRQPVVPGCVLRFHKFLISNGFFPLNLSGRLMLYTLEDIQMAGVVSTILGNEEKLPDIPGFSEVGERRFREFMEGIGRTDLTGLSALTAYSRFFIDTDSDLINGAMLASAYDNRLLYISLISLDEIAKRNLVFPALLSITLSEAEKDLGEDFSFIVNVEEKFIYDGMLQIFNPPDYEFFLPEYACRLNVNDPDGMECSFVSGEEGDVCIISPDDLGESSAKREAFEMDDLWSEPGVSKMLSSKEHHMLSPAGSEIFMSEKVSVRRIKECERILRENVKDFEAQAEKKRMAKLAKGYMLDMWEMKKKLENDPSVSEAEAEKKTL